MNESIYYKSPLGALYITNDGDAISAITFASRQGNPAVNEEFVDYPPATSPVIQACIKQLDEYFAGTRTNFELDLLQPGTPFQQTVWAGLCDIAYGKTLSYLSFSKMLGNSKAIRAVGTANGKNNIPIVIPCHRVIGANGTLVGYGGELWRKKWLLEHEAVHAHGVQLLFPA